MIDKPFTILAPHVDDEVIGCWSLLNMGLVSTVYYFFDLTPDRVAEAICSGEKYNFTPIFLFDGESADWLDVIRENNQGQTILLPSIKDNHPGHKLVSSLGKTLPNDKMFYSIDMNGSFEVLDKDDQDKKRADLLELFPSQASLFEDAKYYLFESIVDSDSRKTIWVSFQKEGIHSYRDAPAEVSFLQNPHRHIFHFRVEIEVFHDDREIEFIMFKRELENLYESGTLKLDNQSCEMMGMDIERYLLTMYPSRCYNISVSEDNENGAVIYSGDW